MNTRPSIRRVLARHLRAGSKVSWDDFKLTHASWRMIRLQLDFGRWDEIPGLGKSVDDLTSNKKTKSSWNRPIEEVAVKEAVRRVAKVQKILDKYGLIVTGPHGGRVEWAHNSATQLKVEVSIGLERKGPKEHDFRRDLEKAL